jgi:hypothetical protein
MPAERPGFSDMTDKIEIKLSEDEDDGRWYLVISAATWVRCVGPVCLG